MTKELVSIKNLTKSFNTNKNIIIILNQINFSMCHGDIISVVGPSGSGKSTFLNILGLLDSAFLGDYRFMNKNVMNLSLNNKNFIRNNSIGFVHQFFHLIPELSVLENVALPNLINNDNYKESIKMAKNILENFGLQNKFFSKPLNLSGGEQQRVAIARALINKPKIIIADEMTGNLDDKTSNIIFDFFLDQIRINQQSLIYVTHNRNYAMKANKKYEIINEKLIKL